jgi:hypothetical protein
LNDRSAEPDTRAFVLKILDDAFEPAYTASGIHHALVQRFDQGIEYFAGEFVEAAKALRIAGE